MFGINTGFDALANTRIDKKDIEYVLGAELRFHLGTHWIWIALGEQATSAECDPLARVWRWYASGEGTRADALRASRECARSRLQWHLGRHAAGLHLHLQRCFQTPFTILRKRTNNNRESKNNNRESIRIYEYSKYLCSGACID